jgi:flagellar hook assembly protein FlgD
VRLDIYNVRGQLVRTLIDAELKAGSYSIVWNGKDKTGQNMASGIYFYRLSSQSGTLARKMFLLK